MTVHFAWPTLREPLVFRVTDVSVDGRTVEQVLIDEDHLPVNIEAIRGLVRSSPHSRGAACRGSPR